MSSTWDDPIFATSEPIKKEEKVEITETSSSNAQKPVQQADAGLTGFEDIETSYSGNFDGFMEDQLDEGVIYINYRGYLGVSGFDGNDINDAIEFCQSIIGAFRRILRRPRHARPDCGFT